MVSFSSGSTSRDILLGCMKGECSWTASIKSTRGLPSVVGRPSPEPEISRPKDTSFGRGLGRCCELVSILGVLRGESSGELGGEGEEGPSGRCVDMIAVAGRIVLRWTGDEDRGSDTL